MGEITGALIGIATVLSAVFVPMAFFGGSVGVIYRQFSVTIVSAMALVRARRARADAGALRDDAEAAEGSWPAQGRFFGWFNRNFERTTNGYRSGVGRDDRRPMRFLVLFVVICGGMGWLFNRLPSSFLPDEDQGILMTSVQLPVGATQDRTLRVLDQVQKHYLNNEKDYVDGVLTVAGFGFGGQGQNVGLPSSG
jgi:multidrug efflux pump